MHLRFFFFTFFYNILISCIFFLQTILFVFWHCLGVCANPFSLKCVQSCILQTHFKCSIKNMKLKSSLQSITGPLQCILKLWLSFYKTMNFHLQGPGLSVVSCLPVSSTLTWPGLSSEVMTVMSDDASWTRTDSASVNITCFYSFVFTDLQQAFIYIFFWKSEFAVLLKSPHSELHGCKFFIRSAVYLWASCGVKYGHRPWCGTAWEKSRHIQICTFLTLTNQTLGSEARWFKLQTKHEEIFLFPK